MMEPPNDDKAIMTSKGHLTIIDHPPAQFLGGVRRGLIRIDFPVLIPQLHLYY